MDIKSYGTSVTNFNDKCSILYKDNGKTYTCPYLPVFADSMGAYAELGLFNEYAKNEIGINNIHSTIKFSVKDLYIYKWTKNRD